MSWKNLFRRQNNRPGPEVTAEDQRTVEMEPEKPRPASDEEIMQRLAAAKQQHREGNIDAAEAVYRDILNKAPGHAEAMHMVAVVCLQRGDFKGAEQRFLQAIALDGTKANYYSNLGNALTAQNRVSDAFDRFKQALELDPRHIEAMSNAATALMAMGRAGEAKIYCSNILELEPDDLNARLGLAVAHMEERDAHSAIRILREGLEIQPGNVNLLIQLASALELVNQLDESLAILQQIEVSHQGFARVSMLTGVIARRRGDLDVAEQRLKEALAQGLTADEQIEAFNQLGLTLDAQGKAQEAFVAFEHSNRGMTERVGQERSNGTGFLRDVQTIQDFLTEGRFAAFTETGAAAGEQQPVFFVGFPRSGTTLMEQALKAHPELVTTDERSPLLAVIREIHGSFGGYPGGLAKLSGDDTVRLRQLFQDFCRDSIGDMNGRRLVDKLPLNIVHLGLARTLFPQAKIVVALRDPRDVCLSCFMQKFDINEAMANFLNLRSTAQAYAAVMGLWLHYRKELSDGWMEYRYEELVENFEDNVTEVLDFIGVGWHEEVRNYREAAGRRAITTPSYRDVTAEVNSRAVARWSRYKNELAPILPVLEPYVKAFGYD